MPQVTLQRREEYGRGRYWKNAAVLKSWPYIIARGGTMTHRVRSGVVHSAGHTYYEAQCGQCFIADQRYGAKLSETPNPSERPLCHKCETMAVKRSQPSSEAITGGPVKYHQVTKRKRHAASVPVV